MYFEFNTTYLHQVLNFTSDWKDGAVLTKLSMDHFPSTWNPDELNVLDAAEKYLGVPKVRNAIFHYLIAFPWTLKRQTFGI